MNEMREKLGQNAKDAESVLRNPVSYTHLDVYKRQTMKVADFLQISPLRRKTGVHIHILKKKGPLFFLLFCKKRKMIPAGFLSVCCLLFFLECIVWRCL